ncbi:hypothetical protein O9992_00850 [Vibrio lentus]|nr:hypothetical protein [Vibrio lentus]
MQSELLKKLTLEVKTAYDKDFSSIVKIRLIRNPARSWALKSEMKMLFEDIISIFIGLEAAWNSRSNQLCSQQTITTFIIGSIVANNGITDGSLSFGVSSLCREEN